MNAEEALEFLSRHQPLPPDERLDEAILARLVEVAEYLEAHPDDRAVPLLLGCIGDRDAFGVYESVSSAIEAHPAHVVVPNLRATLQRPGNDPQRAWALQVALVFRPHELLPDILPLVESPDRDVRFFAAANLQTLGGPLAIAAARKRVPRESDPEIAEILDATIAGRPPT